MIHLDWLKDFPKISDYRLLANEKNDKNVLEFYYNLIEMYEKLNWKYKFNEELNKDYIDEQLHNCIKKKNNSLSIIPFGIKDVINTKVLNTTMGSDIWQGFNAGNNARIVDNIIDNGGIIFSKTTTAEFAVHYLPYSKTINPHNEKHIPGTSSSGSAVAVACGALPVCLGTQTAASIIRPASFCGVYGFKPSFGALDRTGVLKTTDTLDTIGFLGNELTSFNLILDLLRVKGGNYPFSKSYESCFNEYSSKNTIRVAFLTDEFEKFSNYETEIKKDLEEIFNVISRESNIQIVHLSEGIKFINEIHDLHEIIYSKSLAYYFQKEYEETNRISKLMNTMIIKGKDIPTKDYLIAISKQIELSKLFNNIVDDIDFIITPSTASTAPLIGESELDDSGLIWTFLGCPQISLPIFKSAKTQLPYGLQVTAKKYHDYPLLKFSEKLENILKKNI